jgi:hypothetical protein
LNAPGSSGNILSAAYAAILNIGSSEAQPRSRGLPALIFRGKWRIAKLFSIYQLIQSVFPLRVCLSATTLRLLLRLTWISPLSQRFSTVKSFEITLCFVADTDELVWLEGFGLSI